LGGFSVLAFTVYKIQVITYVSGAYAPGMGPSSQMSLLIWITPVIAVFYTGAKLWALVVCVAYARLFRRLAHKRF
jgi:hypothetical protein